MWKKKKIKNESAILTEEERDENIEESLQEIYADEDGKAVDVKKFDIKKRRGPLFWLAVSLAFAGLAGLAGWFYRDYSFFTEPGKSNFEITITPSKEKVLAGEEITVVIGFKNMEKTVVSNLGVRVIFPDNFIITNTVPSAEKSSEGARNLFWNIGTLDSKRIGEVSVKGKIIAPAENLSTIYAEAVYTPANFSSEFKKTATAEIGVNDIGINFNFSAFTSAVAGEENELAIKFSGAKDNKLENFSLKMESKNGDLKIIPVDGEIPAWLKKNPAIPNEWKVSEITAEEREFPVKFIIGGKTSPEDEIKIAISTESGGEEFGIFEKTFPFEVIKGDLALSMIINGSKNDQGVNFGDTLNYLISYSNKGDTALKDVIIMAVIDGDAVNWSALDDPSGGKRSGNTLSWSKNEIAELENIFPGAEGNIEFSLKVENPSGVKKNEEIKSYARYSIVGQEEAKDNISNTIISKLNSRLDLEEKVVYFNEDNIAVGSGPLPPRAGETTTFQVSWAAGGNIHELSGTSVEMSLPEGVAFAGRENANVGQVSFLAAENKVVWTIGRLPVLGEMITASFNLSVTPTDADRGKIMVLSGGSKVSGLDSETNTSVLSITKPKTTKLEDDEIGAGDGVVR
ncbi:MAG: hypothetical protein WCW25_00635 [Patescibacteria group bacterium]|jgi:uncharacterized repeat protein (TIGR01451 family)